MHTHSIENISLQLIDHIISLSQITVNRKTLNGPFIWKYSYFSDNK